jgi:hypothetical protein
MDQAPDRAGSLVAGYAHQLLADLLRSGDVPRAEAACCADKGWRVLVVACPAPPESVVPDLTPCERRCVEVLAADIVGKVRRFQGRNLGEQSGGPPEHFDLCRTPRDRLCAPTQDGSRLTRRRP